jgi:hypothetical protein
LRCRNTLAEIFAVLLVTLSLALVDCYPEALGAEPEVALTVRNEEGRESKVTGVSSQSSRASASEPKMNRVKSRYGRELPSMRF